MAERYDIFNIITVGDEEKESLQKVVSFLNRSFLSKDSAIDYLKLFDVLTQTKKTRFEVKCEDYTNNSSYTYKSSLTKIHYRLESPEFTGEDIHKAITIAIIIK